MSDVEKHEETAGAEPLTGVVAIPLAVGNGVVGAAPLTGVVGAAPLAEPLLKKIINIYKDLRPKKNEKT